MLYPTENLVPAANLKAPLLDNFLDKIGNRARRIAVGVCNETTVTWNEAQVYFFSGRSSSILPYEVQPGMALAWSARKNLWRLEGAVAAFGYYMGDGNTLGVMFSVPYDQNLYTNQWNAKVYQRKRKIDRNMYRDLCRHAIKGDGSWQTIQDIGCGYSMRGTMTESATSKLEIHIRHMV